METVRSIEVVRGRLKITFDSGWQVWLFKNDSAAARLAEGSEVSREEFLKHVCIVQYPSALNKAVSMLAARACSRKEIENRLRQCRFEEDVISLVCCKLDQQNLLDDRDFAAQWVRSRMTRYGTARIQQELRTKGIDAETAEDAMKAVSEEDQLAHAVSFAHKKIAASGKEADRRKLAQRVTAALLRRGYTWETASKAFREALEQTESES